MILFYEDWGKYPNAIVDVDTKNKTALRYALLLKKRGIKNHAFILALHDPSLKNVDPFDPNLDMITIAKIVQEININPWYYFREIIRVPQTGVVGGVSFMFNRYNVGIIWLFFNHVSTMGLVPRQFGKSLTANAIYSGLMTSWSVNDTLSLLTKSSGLRLKTVNQLKDIIESLPYYLQLQTGKDTWNTENISINALGNNLVTNVGQSSIAGALKVGIGETSSTYWIDEIAFVSNIDHTLPAALGASGAAIENARKNKKPFGTMYTTTAGYLNTTSGKFAKDIYDNGMPFTELLFDTTNEVDLYKLVRKNSKDHTLLVTVEFNHRQLGKDDEWLKSKIEASRATGDAILANYLNKWITGSSTSPISKVVLKLIEDSIVKEPNIKLSTNGYLVKWYIDDDKIERYKSKPFIFGSDTSDAIGRDDITVCGRDPETAEVIMTMMCNETNTLDFADFIVDILLDFVRSILIMERKLNGGTIIDHILRILPTKGIDPFSRLFNFVVQEATINKKYREIIDTPMDRRESNVYTKLRKQFGYATSGGGRASRDNIYGTNLLNSCKYSGRTVRDKVLAEQLLGLVVKNGRIDHGDGEHDDMVIAWLLVYYFLTKSENVEYYGLNTRHLLNDMVTHSADIKDLNKLKKLEEQEDVKKEILNILDDMGKTKNSIIAKKMMYRILMLNEKLDIDIKNKFNLNARLQEVEDMNKYKKKRYWER